MKTHALKGRLIDPLQSLLSQIAVAYGDLRPQSRVCSMAMGLLCGEKPKTVTSSLAFTQEEDKDWSASYRLFAQSQCNPQAYFEPILRQGLATMGAQSGPVITAQDDSLFRKTGRHIPGVRYMRDPLSPPFQVNLVLGQRFVQCSLLLQPAGPEHPWRAIPLRFDSAFTPKIPNNATAEEKKALKAQRQQHRLGQVGLEQLRQIRAQLDACGRADRQLLDTVDGSYTNRHFLGNLPVRTDVVGRFRKDAKLRAYLPKEQRVGARKYGDVLPTPKEYLANEAEPCQVLRVWACGQWRDLRYKVMQRVCWPSGLKDQKVRIILLKPMGYRLRKGSKLLYRQPAYLITTDLTSPIATLIAAYLARWEIEVSFRDEKSILGVGQAQVRNPQSAERLPMFMVACYSALLLSCIQAFKDQRSEAFDPLPKWRRNKPLRPSLRDLLRLLRRETLTLKDNKYMISVRRDKT